MGPEITFFCVGRGAEARRLTQNGVKKQNLARLVGAEGPPVGAFPRGRLSTPTTQVVAEGPTRLVGAKGPPPLTKVGKKLSFQDSG